MAFGKKTELPDDVKTVNDELTKLGAVARQAVKVLATHGGEMEHKDIVKRLTGASEADIKLAFAECRSSHLLYDKWPSANDPRHTWTITPYALSAVQSNLAALEA